MMQGRVAWMVLACVLGALGLVVLGICVGSVGCENVMRPLLSPELDPQGTALARQIVWEIRLPRTMGAWAAGALLGLAGAVAQGLFRNPLAIRICWAVPRAPRWVWPWRWRPWAVAPACWAAAT
jgi:iron complex transport system permease protein